MPSFPYTWLKACMLWMPPTTETGWSALIRTRSSSKPSCCRMGLRVYSQPSNLSRVKWASSSRSDMSQTRTSVGASRAEIQSSPATRTIIFWP